MMKPLYAVRDDKARLFNPPFTCSNDAVAMRQFGDVVTSKDVSLITNHPADFSLHFIGLFDDEVGILKPREGGTDILCRGSDFVTSDNSHED